mgnify:CR=1 FL=1
MIIFFFQKKGHTLFRPRFGVGRGEVDFRFFVGVESGSCFSITLFESMAD